MTEKEGLYKSIMENGGSIKKSSVMNPILWLCLITSTPSLVFLYMDRPLPFWLLLVMALPIATAVFTFIYLLFMNKGLLKSEEYCFGKKDPQTPVNL